MSTKYLCKSWQGLLRMAVNLIGNGYYYVHLTYLPDAKQDQWKAIDRKMIAKYKLENVNKDKLYQRKKKGLANFRYLRWHNVILILHTEGNILIPSELELALLRKHGKIKNKLFKTPKQALMNFNKKQQQLYEVCCDDEFTDVRKYPAFLKISDQVAFDIRMFQKVTREEPIKNKKGKIIKKGKKLLSKPQATVRLTKEVFRNKRAEFADYLEAKAKNKVLYSFEMLNNLPAWRGIILQKQDIKNFILSEAQKHNIHIKASELVINDRRVETENIFEDEDT